MGADVLAVLVHPAHENAARQRLKTLGLSLIADEHTITAGLQPL